MNIKIKAMIYRYFGIYLANNEELEYLTSKNFWTEFSDMIKHPDNDYSYRTIQGILIGSWQAKNGLCRPWGYIRWMPRSYPLQNFIETIYSSYLAVKWDLLRLIGK